jgi:hypothetical protein
MGDTGVGGLEREICKRSSRMRLSNSNLERAGLWRPLLDYILIERFFSLMYVGYLYQVGIMNCCDMAFDTLNDACL